MFLGIDLGTSGVKAIVLSEDGVLQSQSSAPLTVSRPQDLWSEQEADDWWTAAQAAVRLPLKLRAMSWAANGAGAPERIDCTALTWSGRALGQAMTLSGSTGAASPRSSVSLTGAL
ncbi:MAG: FGGY family carbohydrate kinase [Novosphingobium sp.]|nr:FGGY family carbohydrate kinase [Novosphingobium sp.]